MRKAASGRSAGAGNRVPPEGRDPPLASSGNFRPGGRNRIGGVPFESRSADSGKVSFKNLYEFAPAGLFDLDRAGRILRINLSGAALLETERSLLVGMPFLVFVENEDTDAYLEHLHLCRKTLKRQSVELSLGLSGRPIGVFRVDNVPVRGPDNEFSEFRCAIYDVSEVRRRENLLRRRLARLNTAADLSTLALGDATVRSLAASAAKAVADALDAEFVLVLERLPDNSGLRILSRFGLKASGHPDVLPAGEHRLAEGVQYAGGAHNFHDLRLAPPVPLPRILRDAGAASGLLASIGQKKDTFGSVEAYARRLNAFEEEDRSFLHLIAAILDVAIARRRSEANTAAEKSFREDVQNSVDTGLAAMDLKGRILSVNDKFSAMTGMRREKLVGMGPPYAFWPPETQEWFDAERAHLAVRGGGGPRHLEFRLRPGRGKRVDVLMSFSALRDHRGISHGLVVSLTDISERKKAEEALRDSEERFRALVEHSPVGFFIVRRGKIVLLNPAQERIFGVLPSTRALADFAHVHPEDRKTFLSLGAHAGSAGIKGRTMEIRFLLPAEGEAEGKTVWTTCRTSTVPWRGGRAVLVNMVDTTRAKELEQIVLAREKMASLGQMAGSIAHEIRNPLSGVNIYLAAIGEILAKPGAVAGPTAGELEGALAGIRTASEKMEDVIGRVMKFLKPGPARNEEADINAAIGEAIHGAQLLLRRQGVILTQTLTPELPLCRGDRKLLEQVMLNLITNAVQAMAGKAGKKSIEIASCRDGDLLYVSVGDSGPGVPPALRKKIFDPFFTTRSDGTGIGLAFSHRVVTDHGGSISVGDGPLGGAEFRLKLPLAGGAAAGNKDLPGK